MWLEGCVGRGMTHRTSAWGQVFQVLSQECGGLGLWERSPPLPALQQPPHEVPTAAVSERRGAGAGEVGMEIQPLSPACPWSWGYSP